MSPFRILIAIPAYWPAVTYGGPVAKARHLASELVASGNEVTVLTSNVIDRSSTATGGTRTEWVDGVRVVYLDAVARRKWIPLTPGVVPWLRRESGFDVVHVMGLRDPIGLAAAVSARTRRQPLVIEPLGMTRPVPPSRSAKRAWDRIFTAKMFRWADRVIANSQVEAREIRASWPDVSLEVRPNGVDLQGSVEPPPRGTFRRRWGLAEDAPVVLTLARLSRTKGLDGLVRAVAALPPAHLVLAGPDDGDGTRERVLRLAGELRMADRLHLVGWLDGEEKRAALGDASVFALTPSVVESFGNAALDAAAASVPIVLTDVCGAADHLRVVAEVVPYDVDAIRDALARVLADPKRASARAAAGRAVIEDLTWPRIAKLQLAIYDDVISGTRPSRAGGRTLRRSPQR